MPSVALCTTNFTPARLALAKSSFPSDDQVAIPNQWEQWTQQSAGDLVGVVSGRLGHGRRDPLRQQSPCPDVEVGAQPLEQATPGSLAEVGPEVAGARVTSALEAVDADLERWVVSHVCCFLGLAAVALAS